MKKLLVLLGVLVLLVLAGAAAASWWILRQFGPETWVAQAENQWNCRAQIGDVDLRLLARPATLVLKDVHLARRDSEAAKPLAERKAFAEGEADIHVAELRLDVRLEDLLNRRLHVEDLRLVRPTIRETLDAKGSSLEAIFRKPAEAGTAAQKPATPKPAAPKTAAGDEVTELPRGAGGFSFALAQAAIEDGALTLNAKDNVIEITRLGFRVGGIDLEQLKPGTELAAELEAHLRVTGLTRIQGAKRQAELAVLDLRGTGSVAPLDAKTGRWKPNTLLNLTLAKGSVLAGQQTLGDAAGSELRKLQEFGIDLSPVHIGGPLQQDTVIAGRWVGGAFILREQALFVFPEYEVALEQKCWLDTVNDRHEFDVRLTCGPELQQRLHQGMAKAKLGESVARGLVRALADERGRMTFDIESRGPLSDPKVRPKTDRVLKNLMSGQGLGDLLQGLLR
jgi:hypothetical protein